jgi:hypothetical protein
MPNMPPCITFHDDSRCDGCQQVKSALVELPEGRFCSDRCHLFFKLKWCTPYDLHIIINSLHNDAITFRKQAKRTKKELQRAKLLLMAEQKEKVELQLAGMAVDPELHFAWK